VVDKPIAEAEVLAFFRSRISTCGQGIKMCVDTSMRGNNSPLEVLWLTVLACGVCAV
jgi:hypothetical protein